MFVRYFSTALLLNTILVTSHSATQFGAPKRVAQIVAQLRLSSSHIPARNSHSATPVTTHPTIASTSSSSSTSIRATTSGASSSASASSTTATASTTRPSSSASALSTDRLVQPSQASLDLEFEIRASGWQGPRATAPTPYAWWVKHGQQQPR